MSITYWLRSRWMTHVGCAFVDVVSGRAVNRYRDANGRMWLASSSWGFDRIPSEVSL